MKRSTVIKLTALAVSLVLCGIDRLTKVLVTAYVKPLGSVPLISFGDTQALNFTYCENTGMSFSLLSGQRVFLIIVPLLLIGAVEFLIFSGKVKKTRTVMALASLAGGGLGNLIDRIATGYVVDFIDVRLINFAIFNFADICAVCGGFAVVLFMLIDEHKHEEKTEDTQTVNAQDSAALSSGADAEDNTDENA